MPGLEFLDESEELMMGLLALCLAVRSFLDLRGVARGKRLEGSTPGVSSFIRVLKAKILFNTEYNRITEENIFYYLSR